MKCYRCKSDKLVLTPLSDWERELYPQVDVVLRTCQHCLLEQNHVGDDEAVKPLVAAQEAPVRII